MRRSLVLAGGGAKVGWQAGVLQVLFEEANLRFDHIDATSGAMFNLAMLLSGRTATQVADAWASTSPVRFVSIHKPWRYLAPWTLPSLATQNAIRDRILPRWGIDLEKIRACRAVYGHPVIGTFNVVDFGAKSVKSIPHSQMDRDLLLAVDAVPGLVPPVFRDGTLYTDAMYLKDQNLAEAVRRGADEIWVIWTVRDEPVWKGGFWNHLIHVFETTANGNYKRELREIEEINHRVHTGRAASGQRHITVHELRPDSDLPAGYLLWRRRSMQRSIDLGRRSARDYLVGRGLLEPTAPPPTPRNGLTFTETMSGYFMPGEADFAAGERDGEAAGNDLSVTLAIAIDDLDRFVDDPEHFARAEGSVRSRVWGGTCPISRGTFNLFRPEGKDARRMDYEAAFQAADGRRYVLRGHKAVRDEPGVDLWADTTTLMVRVVDAQSNAPVGAGILRLTVPQFARQLMSFRATGTSNAGAALETISRFGMFFAGRLWDVYGASFFRRQG